LGIGSESRRESRYPSIPLAEKGTVSRGPQKSADGTMYYLLMMDKDDPAEVVIFKAEEIEPDV
jgi:hypothetical protein